MLRLQKILRSWTRKEKNNDTRMSRKGKYFYSKSLRIKLSYSLAHRHNQSKPKCKHSRRSSKIQQKKYNNLLKLLMRLKLSI